MTVYELAKRYHDSGYAVIPLKVDGSKMPVIAWRKTHWQRFEWKEIDDYFRGSSPCGIGIVCGKISGGLEGLDFDDTVSYPRFIQALDPSLIALVKTFPLIATPRGGNHTFWRCDTTSKKEDLARNETGKAFIELKSEGSYIVAFGSPADTHPSGKKYRLISGNPFRCPLITTEQRAELLRVARQLNRYVKVSTVKVAPAKIRTITGNRIGDRYNATEQWENILCPMGWEVERVSGNFTYWRKPHSPRGQSHATSGLGGDKDLFYCHTTDGAPFEANQTYQKFAAYALLYHGGDFSRAAKALLKQQSFLLRYPNERRKKENQDAKANRVSVK
jgi:putative DNA primase/helicase